VRALMSSANVPKLKKKAADFEAKKQFDRALSLYIQLLEEAGRDLDDADLQLFNRVGDLLQRQGNMSEALAYYEKAVDMYAERGFLNNAIALCNKILRQSPARTAVYYKLGKISANKGFKSDAKKNFLEYADRMQKSGHVDEAFRALKEFADLCPDQDDIRLMLAEWLNKENRKSEAIEQLETLYNKLEAEGRAAEARATIDRIKAIDPDVVPRQSGAWPVQKSNDLVFLDLGAEEAPLARRNAAPASEPTSPAAEPQRPQVPRVAALEGLTLTFIPDEDEGVVVEPPAVVEGFEATGTGSTSAVPTTAEEVEALLGLQPTASSEAAPADVGSLLEGDANDWASPSEPIPLLAGLESPRISLSGAHPSMAPLLDQPPMSGQEFAQLPLVEDRAPALPRPVSAHDLAIPSDLPLLPMGEPPIDLLRVMETPLASAAIPDLDAASLATIDLTALPPVGESIDTPASGEVVTGSPSPFEGEVSRRTPVTAEFPMVPPDAGPNELARETESPAGSAAAAADGAADEGDAPAGLAEAAPGVAADEPATRERDTADLIAQDDTGRVTDEILVVPSEEIDEETKRSLRLEFALDGDETPDAWVEAAMGARDDFRFDRLLTPLGMAAISDGADSAPPAPPAPPATEVEPLDLVECVTVESVSPDQTGGASDEIQASLAIDSEVETLELDLPPDLPAAGFADASPLLSREGVLDVALDIPGSLSDDAGAPLLELDVLGVDPAGETSSLEMPLLDLDVAGDETPGYQGSLAGVGDALTPEIDLLDELTPPFMRHDAEDFAPSGVVPVDSTRDEERAPASARVEEGEETVESDSTDWERTIDDVGHAPHEVAVGAGAPEPGLPEALDTERNGPDAVTLESVIPEFGHSLEADEEELASEIDAVGRHVEGDTRDEDGAERESGDLHAIPPERLGSALDVSALRASIEGRDRDVTPRTAEALDDAQVEAAFRDVAADLPLIDVGRTDEETPPSIDIEPLDLSSLSTPDFLAEPPGFGAEQESIEEFVPEPTLAPDTLESDEWPADAAPEVLIDGEWRDEHVGGLVSGEVGVITHRPDGGAGRQPPRFDDLSAALLWPGPEPSRDAGVEVGSSSAGVGQGEGFMARMHTPRSTLSLGGIDAQLRRRLELDPANHAIRRQLGEALLDQGERDAGLEELEIAMRGFEVIGDLEGARTVAEVVLRVIPTSVRHHQKRVEYAVRSNDRVRLVEAYVELADSLFRSGEPDKARVVYSRVLELSPGNGRARFALGLLTAEPEPRTASLPTTSDPSPAFADVTDDSAAPDEPALPTPRTPGFVHVTTIFEQGVASPSAAPFVAPTTGEVEVVRDDTLSDMLSRRSVTPVSEQDTAAAAESALAVGAALAAGAEFTESTQEASAPIVHSQSDQVEQGATDGPDASDDVGVEPFPAASLDEEIDAAFAAPPIVESGSDPSLAGTSAVDEYDFAGTPPLGAAALATPFIAGSQIPSSPTPLPGDKRDSATSTPAPHGAPPQTPRERESPLAQPVEPSRAAASSPSQPTGGDDDFVDLGSWLRDDEPVRSTRMVAEEAAPTGDEKADFDEMLRRFKQGVAANVDEEDYASHYDLGVAYKEMGLMDEAIAEFQKSLRGDAHRVRSYEALGQCFVEKGQLQVALTLLKRAVETQGTDDQQLVGVLYLLGYASEVMARHADALSYYQRVFAVDIEFRDVAQRVAAMEHLSQ